MRTTRYFCDACGLECVDKVGLKAFFAYVVEHPMALRSEMPDKIAELCDACSAYVMKFMRRARKEEL